MPEGDASPSQPQITRILRRLAEGLPGAADELVPIVYEELQAIARRSVSGLQPGQTIQATALVHEAWVRLGAREAVAWNDRAHFFGAAARAMRFILVEEARRKGRIKRGGEARRQPMPDQIATPELGATLDLEALDQALSRFESEHPRPARVVMLRYFAGQTVEEIAKMLEVSTRTAERDWLFARSWLRQALSEENLG